MEQKQQKLINPTPFRGPRLRELRAAWVKRVRKVIVRGGSSLCSIT